MNGYPIDAETPLDAADHLHHAQRPLLRAPPLEPGVSGAEDLVADGGRRGRAAAAALARGAEGDAADDGDLRPAVRRQRPGAPPAGRPRRPVEVRRRRQRAVDGRARAGPARAGGAEGRARGTCTRSARTSRPQKVPPFHRSLELEKVLEDGVVAFEMNGEPLPQLARRAGAPRRPGLGRRPLDEVARPPDARSPSRRRASTWTRRTASRTRPGEPGVAFKPDEMNPVTELFVKSNITRGAGGARRLGQPVTIRGFAFSGAPDIAKVEVTDDGGATWTEAELGHGATTRTPGGSGRSASAPKAAGKVDAPRARDGQPRQRPAEGRRLEPERLPLQRLAVGGDRGERVRPRAAPPAAVAAAALAGALCLRSVARSPAPPESRLFRSSGTELGQFPPGPMKAVADQACLQLPLGRHGAAAAPDREAVDGRGRRR